MKGGQRIGAESSRSLRRFIWRPDRTGIIYLPTVPHILHTLLFLPPSFCDKTHDAKASVKNLGVGRGSLKTFQLRTVRGPHALVPIKYTGVSLAHYSNWQRNIGEVSAASAGAAVSFHTTWMELPRQPHSRFCVGLGYLPVPARRPTVPETELEFPFYNFIILIFFFCGTTTNPDWLTHSLSKYLWQKRTLDSLI